MMTCMLPSFRHTHLTHLRRIARRSLSSLGKGFWVGLALGFKLLGLARIKVLRVSCKSVSLFKSGPKSFKFCHAPSWPRVKRGCVARLLWPSGRASVSAAGGPARFLPGALFALSRRAL